MAAPMLFASVCFKSHTLPIVTDSMQSGSGLSRPSSVAPAPVTVHCAVGVR